MSTTKKQLVEEQFHDNYAKSVDLKTITINENYSLAAQENRFAKSIFGNFKNKRILDLGCGFGETAIYWAKKGAIVDAVDISQESVNIGKKLAKKFKVAKSCKFQQMASENLQFPDDNFDYVFGNGVLHHVEIEKTSKEINRVLKPGGLAVFIEPLAYNPVINVYRQIAEEVRTPTEKPLTFNEINQMKKHFTLVKHREFQFFTLLIFIWFLLSKISPNKERYWRKILKVRGRQKTVLKLLISLDNLFLKFVPPLRYLCWNTVIELQK